MFRPISRLSATSSHLPRRAHSSSHNCQALKQKQLTTLDGSPKKIESSDRNKTRVQRHIKRNELGVQLLSRELHSQIFENVSFPAPDSSYIQISKEHLAIHGLDPTQGSVLPDTGFKLPHLQGDNLAEHFYRIGAQVAEPWLSLAKEHAAVELPPRPDHWEIQSGWTKYTFMPDGSSYSEHVEYPTHNGEHEQMLTFDVETLPKYSPFSIMACAASQNAWYAWISPWLLGQTKDPQQLIPFGDPSVSRVIIGHNISYDRKRVLEEYSLVPTANRFIDTMSLHVAVKGISSHQRPAWMKYRKAKASELQQQEEAVEAIYELMQDVEERQQRETDSTKKQELIHLHQEMADSLAQLQSVNNDEIVDVDGSISEMRWEEMTSANSLADVALLHCGIPVLKETRNDFMILSPEEIRANIVDYLDYCSNDVHVTHQVFSAVLPRFLQGCPHPVSFAGILTMGSSFLTVNEEWEKYLERAEGVYRQLEEGVQSKLKQLAMDAIAMTESTWKDDPWLSQLDWTPKSAGKSRGVIPLEQPEAEVDEEVDPDPSSPTAAENCYSQFVPRWLSSILSKPFGSEALTRIIPYLLKLSYDGNPLQYNDDDRWHIIINGTIMRPQISKNRTTTKILSARALPMFESGQMKSIDIRLAQDISKGKRGDDVHERLMAIIQMTLDETKSQIEKIEVDPWLRQLDWTETDNPNYKSKSSKAVKRPKAKSKPKPLPVLWPKWYWEATKPKKDQPPGTLEITVRNRIAPLLLHLSWLGWPLFHSREYGWTFRVPADAGFTTRANPLSFHDPADDTLAESTLRGGYLFYKLPHKDGEKANVGSPLGKTFMKYALDGTLKSPGDEAKEALDMNAQCSYWISARDRILNQMVVWHDKERGPDLKIPPNKENKKQKWGIILPQVVTMGTVTRRAIEKTWLTASNAKKNRVGSELKAMVRAPEGYAMVGADVDSEELWISSCMGDAQFGLHGATALGWMTLEGTKAAGTDLHSKTANILGISRDQAKVFNYSRIYGAGMRHAILLLLQSNAGMLPEKAQKLAENLYASTKGKNTHRSDIFNRKFWFGGSESYVFNKLEEIALSDRPQTPALGCRITSALSKEYLPATFGQDYMTSRINWVVQSSGVDYLHLLIVSMDYLLSKYDIEARYLISVHDELRYLVKEEDKYRAALALQIANLWTRSLFAYKLGMDDLPQGVAFFSAVDIDRVLRKEVDMPCVTPSQPIPIPPGESLDITGVLAKTNNGSLYKDGRSMANEESSPLVGDLEGYLEPNCLAHRASSAAFLKAQATDDFGEVKGLAQQVYGTIFTGGMSEPTKKRPRKKTPIGNGEGVDWSETVERLMKSSQMLS